VFSPIPMTPMESSIRTRALDMTTTLPLLILEGHAAGSRAEGPSFSGQLRSLWQKSPRRSDADRRSAGVQARPVGRRRVKSCCDRTTVQVSHLNSINKRLTAHRRKDCEDRQRSLKVLGCGW
jgi:hypothetical protein